MHVDSFFHDTVASLRRSEEIRTLLVVMTLLARVHPCVGKTAPQTSHLTSYPEAATDGVDFTLSCTPAQGRTLIGVSWYRNNVYIFDTSGDADASASILHPLTTSPEYQSVSGRISVSSSLQQHNVTLRTKSPLDQGSVWRRKAGPEFSNNITVELKESIQEPSFPALYQTSGGQTVTLTCAGEPGSGGYMSIAWYRNGVEIFLTSSDDPTVILSPVNTSPEYQSVSGRISVSSSLQQHNVTLRTNSTLDQGSVWMCKTGSQFSNNITIEVKQSIQGVPSPRPKSTSNSDTAGHHTGASSIRDKDMMTTNPTVSTKTDFIYVVAGSGGGVVIVVVIVIVALLCIRSRKEGKCHTNDKTEKDSCKREGYNEESKRETIVMEDNDLYHGFVRTENHESAEEQQVQDVYAKVNNVRKTHNATEVQITLSIEDLYAKPNKPASGNSKAASKVSSNQNVDVNTPD